MAYYRPAAMIPTFAENFDLEVAEERVSEPAERVDNDSVPLLCRLAADGLLRHDAEFARYAHAAPARDGLSDFLCATGESAQEPRKIFKRLRWGGQCLIASQQHKEIVELAERYQRHGFEMDRGPTYVRHGRLRIPFFSKKIHAFVARKVELIPPGEITNRFTYQVRLTRHSDPNEPVVVLKEVPSLESVVHRLSKKHRDYTTSGLEKLAHKFTDKIFPTFLTREAAMLMILQEHLPAPYNQRVPRLINKEQDERGFVRRFRM